MMEYTNKLQEAIQSISLLQILDLIGMIKNSDRIFVVGNGGCSSIAQHFSTDLLKYTDKKVYVLDNQSTITMIANDIGYDKMFSWFIVKTGYTAKSLVICLSTSGCSKNIIDVIDNISCKKVLITNDKVKAERAHLKVCIHSEVTQILEDVIHIICHMVVTQLRRELCKESQD